MMGKKKVTKKTKELSVALAESSSSMAMGGEETQVITPRKRGRPRKIVEKTEEDESASAAGAGAVADDRLEAKRTKTSDDQEEQEEDKEETKKEEDHKEHKQQPRRSRAKRKGKPTKSR